jgi:23S rRNA pseudouridine1911/1915/1917 synthase
MKRRSFTVEADAPLATIVAQSLGVSSSNSEALISGGAVYVDGRRARSGAGVRSGARVMVVLEEGGVTVTAPSLPAAPLVVLFEDDDVLAVDKPSGVVAQPTPGRAGDSLVDLASAHLGRQAGLVHRLDRETSGVTIFGKHAQATSRLAAAFREGLAKKEYLAVTRPGLPPSGTIDLPLSKDPSRPGRWRASRSANGIDALTHYTRLSDGEVSVVALFPQTGRTHQLRAHLCGIGHPIVGDTLYGGDEGPRCLLHARRLVIDGVTFEAPVPADLAKYLAHATTT